MIYRLHHVGVEEGVKVSVTLVPVSSSSFGSQFIFVPSNYITYACLTKG